MLSYPAQIAELEKLVRLESGEANRVGQRPRLEPTAPVAGARCLVCGLAPAFLCASCQSVHYCSEAHQKLDARWHALACERLREIHEDTTFRDSTTLRDLSRKWLKQRASARGPRVLEGWKAYLEGAAFEGPAHRRALTDLASRPMTIARLLHDLGLATDQLVRVHVMAASAKELQSLALYQELGALWPQLRFDVALVGPELPQVPLPQLPGVSVSLHSRPYRRASWSEFGRPHLIVGFDAGLLLYRTWGPTMLELVGSGVSVAITSYRSFEANAEASLLRRLGAVPLRPPQPNPFASLAARRSASVANDVSYDNSYLSVWR